MMTALILVAAFLSFLACGILIPVAKRFNLLDVPNQRSSHVEVTPRIGGLGLLLGTLAFVIFPLREQVLSSQLFWGLACVFVLVLVGLLDDKFDLPQSRRIVVHLAVTSVLVWRLGLAPLNWGLPYETWDFPLWFAAPFAVLYIMAFINFFNFMDGINGIAGAQCLFGAAGMAVLFRMGGLGSSTVMALCISLAGATVGFLVWNFPKARTFMGDCGSTVLGFTLAALSCYGPGRTDLPFVAFVLPLWPFLYEATFTVIKRAMRHEKVWEAHREHHYQLLIRCGWTHPVVTLLYALQFSICCGAAMAYARFNDDLVRLGILAVLGVCYVGFSVAVHRYFNNHMKKKLAGTSS